MATKPEAWQEPRPADSPNNEPWTQGDVGAATSRSHGKAPRAPPEEDVDAAEAGGEEANLQEDRSFSPDGKDGTAHECEESQRIDEVTEIEPSEMFDYEDEESCVQSEDALPPPPLSELSLEGCLEGDGFSSMEKEAAEWTSDAGIISDPNSGNSQELPQSAECTANSPAENVDELDFSADDFSSGEPEDDSPGPVQKLSDDERVVCSPRFVDESEEEEEPNAGASPVFTAQVLQPLRSESSPQPDELPAPADAPAEQQEALLDQSQPVPAPRGGNQEAAQQVHGQSAPPLSAVSIEVSNQGGAASVVTVREREPRVGTERTEGASEHTGGEEGQKERALEGSKVAPHRGRARSEAGKSPCAVCAAHSGRSRMESDSCDDSQSDSGVSADFSPCSTLEGNASLSAGARETPIEREIRRAIEREHSLRRSRGLPNPPVSPEYVDVPLRKTVLSQSLAASSERHQGKDRQFAGKKMQHDIHRETQREQDLVKLGKVPGVYDKGTVRQIKDRKQIFEVFQKPSDSGVNTSSRSKATSWSSASDTLGQETQEDASSPATTGRVSNGERRQSVDPLGPPQSNHAAKQAASAGLKPRGPGFSEATGCQVIILENNMSIPALKLYHQQEAEHGTAVDSGSPNRIRTNQDAGEDAEARENPFFKLHPSTNMGKVEQEIREAKEREKELREQRSSVQRAARGAKGGGRRGEGSTGMKGRTPVASPSPPNEPVAPESSSPSSRGGIGSTAARQSVGKLGMWPPAEAEEEHVAPPEVVQSPRPPRKKSPLVHRWESGLVNVGEQDF